MDKSRVEPTIFFIEKISFSLKPKSGHFYGQFFIKTVRGPFSIKKAVVLIGVCLCDASMSTPRILTDIKMQVSLWSKIIEILK